MGYMQDTDRWLDGLIEQVAEGKLEVPALKRALREKILESYRNGQQAFQLVNLVEKAEGQSPAPRVLPHVRSEKKQAGKPQRFTGDWQCSLCGRAITSLPFEPKGAGVDRLKCIDCYKKTNQQPQ